LLTLYSGTSKLDKTQTNEKQGSMENRESSFPCFTLFKSFLECNKKSTEYLDIFSLVKEYEEQCCDHLSVLLSLKETRLKMDHKELTNLPPKMETLLRCERNSWRLIRALFEDKIKNEGELVF